MTKELNRDELAKKVARIIEFGGKCDPNTEASLISDANEIIDLCQQHSGQDNYADEQKDSEIPCANCGVEISQLWNGRDQKNANGWRHVKPNGYYYYQCKGTTKFHAQPPKEPEEL